MGRKRLVCISSFAEVIVSVQIVTDWSCLFIHYACVHASHRLAPSMIHSCDSMEPLTRFEVRYRTHLAPPSSVGMMAFFVCFSLVSVLLVSKAIFLSTGDYVNIVACVKREWVGNLDDIEDYCDVAAGRTAYKTFRQAISRDQA